MAESIENITEDKKTKLEMTEEIKHSLKDLMDSCKALGYKKEVVSGAFFNCKKTEMTRREFEEEIKKFLGKKVK